MGHTGGLIKPVPGVEDAEPVIQKLVGLPCLERGRLVKRIINSIFLNFDFLVTNLTVSAMNCYKQLLKCADFFLVYLASNSYIFLLRPMTSWLALWKTIDHTP